MNIRICLADEWRTLHKRSSVIFSGFVGVVAPLGPVLRETWRSMPDDLKMVIPHSVQQGISYTILAATFVALRYTTIQRTDGKPEGGNGNV